MSVIASFDRVEKTFANGVHALGPLDLEIRAGEFVSLLGPSGCGKSTALRLLANLSTPSAGRMSFANSPRIGFVFQDATLMPWARALDNVRLPLDLARMPRRIGNARAEAALARVGLSGFEAAFPRELSGGMRMRVSLARALVAEPELLLLDEPFAALDELTREALDDDLLQLWRDDRMTVVFVTHSVAESTYLSTRTVVLTQRPGRIAADIALSREPAPDREYRFTPAFAADAARISQALRAGLKDAA